MAEDSEAIVLYGNRPTLLVMATMFMVITLAVLAVGISCAQLLNSHGLPLLEFLVIEGCAIQGALLFDVASFFAHHAVVSNALIIVDHDGILDAASPWAVGLIRWEEIDQIASVRISDLPLVRRAILCTSSAVLEPLRIRARPIALGIWLRNPAGFFDRKEMGIQWLYGAFRNLAGPETGIPEHAISGKVEDLHAEIVRRFGAHLRSEWL